MRQMPWPFPNCSLLLHWLSILISLFFTAVVPFKTCTLCRGTIIDTTCQSHKQMSTKKNKSSTNSLTLVSSLVFLCSFRWCTPFCCLRYLFIPLLMIAWIFQQPISISQIIVFLLATQRAKQSTTTEGAVKTGLENCVRLFVLYSLTPWR